MAVTDPRIRTELRVELGSDERPELVRWTTQGIAGGPPRQPHHAYALASVDGVILVDPEEISSDTAVRFEQLLQRMGGAPQATILTSSWHERWAYGCRERFGAPVWFPAAGQAALDGVPDQPYQDAADLPGGLRAFAIGEPPGADAALLWQRSVGRHVLFSGDLIMGSSAGSGQDAGHWRYPAGVYLWMHGHPGRDDFEAGFRRLAAIDFAIVCCAHGRPAVWREQPKAALAALLGSGQFLAPRLSTGIGAAR